jgi:hypothetical protein
MMCEILVEETGSGSVMRNCWPSNITILTFKIFTNVFYQLTAIRVCEINTLIFFRDTE